jgi:hypothetical protein
VVHVERTRPGNIAACNRFEYIFKEGRGTEDAAAAGFFPARIEGVERIEIRSGFIQSQHAPDHGDQQCALRGFEGVIDADGEPAAGTLGLGEDRVHGKIAQIEDA